MATPRLTKYQDNSFLPSFHEIEDILEKLQEDLSLSMLKNQNHTQTLKRLYLGAPFQKYSPFSLFHFVQVFLYKNDLHFVFVQLMLSGFCKKTKKK